MGADMAAWIQASMAPGGSPRSGGFKRADANHRVKSSRAFSNALITEVTVPKLDGASKEALYFDIGFEAEQVVLGKASGETIGAILGVKPKAGRVCDFRIEIGSLPCARVAAVDAFTWKCAVASGGRVGRRPVRRTDSATVPDLRLSIAAADYMAWADAATKWFVDGQAMEGDEMAGRIVFLAANLRDELGSIELSNVGFRRFVHPVAEAGGTQAERFSVELYVEAMAFKLKG
jgi:hypothetical protein